MVLLGPKDVESGTLAVRVRDGKAKDGSRQMNGVTSEALLKRLTEEISQKSTRPSEDNA
jgi:threonyl-tRNA synthetase